MPKLSQEKKGKIIELREKGYGYRSIAERVGVSSETAHKYGRGVRMKDDRRYGRGGSVKELVKKESRRLIGVEQIRPSHREKFDRLILQEVDNAIKSLAQALQKLPALPLSRKAFIRRLVSGIVLLKWGEIEKMLKKEEV